MSDIRKRTGAKGTNYQVRYPSKAAKSGYAYATFATRKEARDFSENLGAVKVSPSGTKLDVADAVDRWLAICEKIGRDGRETVEPETLKEYKRRAKVAKEYAWLKQIHELEPADIVRFRTWLLENKTRDLARRTLSSFHSILIEMKLQGFLKDDPAAGITIRSDGRYEDEDSDAEIPSDQEVRDILAATERLRTKNDFMAKCWARYKPMIHLAVFSGMRPSEYRGLPWINLAEGVVSVRQRADKTGIIGPVKSKAGRRTLRISSQITDMIFEWREQCPKSDDDLVFPTDSGKPIALSNFVASAWAPLMREAGLVISDETKGVSILRPKYSPYCLRHYQASKLIEKSKDAKYIQTFMGHSDIKITYNTYGHLMKDREDRHKQTAEEIAADLLG
ncbi:tyrosine-type recombinase/integrase [Sinorhizobium meliloti]|uniref:tyrosine-type recombinase/integrase n=1 Tax=Rhizobium meliloti TaxID=382 RepID=UPI000FDA0788|nr:tyrosine-type recombinase/integrase [Sinorhizobium meliloti]RVI34221.1 site-specific integrase [Sinorhizobium meliloti]